MADFTICRKRVGDRVHSLYFESWLNAEKWMLQDVQAGKYLGLWGEVKKERRFLPAKGFEEYNIHAKNRKGEEVVWSLLDGYFSDHLLDIE